MSSILIPHDLGLAAQYCDRIMVMKYGRIVEQGPTEQVMRAPSDAYTSALLAAAPKPPARRVAAE